MSRGGEGRPRQTKDQERRARLEQRVEHLGKLVERLQAAGGADGGSAAIRKMHLVRAELSALRSAIERWKGAEAALLLAYQHGPGELEAPQLRWLVDKMVRALTGPYYAAWVRRARAGTGGPETYEWPEGVAP